MATKTAKRPRNIEPVGIVEIAERLDVAETTVRKWWNMRAESIGFPEPKWTVGGRPCWLWSDVWAWAHDTERLP